MSKATECKTCCGTGFTSARYSVGGEATCPDCKGLGQTNVIPHLQRLWDEVESLQRTIGRNDKPEIPGISGEDLDWDLEVAMLHLARARQRAETIAASKVKP